jgi:hypothetical protein
MGTEQEYSAYPSGGRDGGELGGREGGRDGGELEQTSLIDITSLSWMKVPYLIVCQRLIPRAA